MSKLRITSLALCLAWAALAGACEQHQPVCVRKKVVDCFCETSERGTQICADDGYGYGACTCTPDAGTPSDAPSDAPNNAR